MQRVVGADFAHAFLADGLCHRRRAAVTKGNDLAFHAAASAPKKFRMFLVAGRSALPLSSDAVPYLPVPRPHSLAHGDFT